MTTDQIEIKNLPFEVDNRERFNAIADDLASGFTNLEDLYDLYNFLDLDIPLHTDLVTVIPDNYLYRIPLEVLPTRSPDSPISYGSTRYMLEDHHFRYFTSLKEFDSNRRNPENKLNNDFAAFAISNFEDFTINDLPSLPYATVESNNIESILTSLNNKVIYNGDEATKAAFKHSVGNSRMVHVATHSEVSEQNPLFSTIYLKNPESNGDLESEQALYAYELFDTPLNSEFIMLNSCSSGSGKYLQGSGIMGISRALKYAGAKSLALNLWSVNDKIASEFATDFYSFLNEGHTKSESIRLAKLNQLKSANANPHFWGAYMMIGNPSPITQKNDGLLFIVSLLAFSTIFMGYTAYKKSSH
jgi:CHAT domain-containing protein